MAANLYWQGMKKKIQEFIKSCDTCQMQKYLASSPYGLLQLLPIPSQVWSDISIDFIVGLPKSRGYEAIFVIVDRLSKYGHFVPINTLTRLRLLLKSLLTKWFVFMGFLALL